MRLGVARALVDGAVVPGDVTVDDGVVTGVGVAAEGGSGTAVPGFVDVQVNGFAGVDYLDATAEEFARAGAVLAATGVTAYQPTFICSPPEAYDAALAEAAAAQGRPGPRLLGVHLEGPFISPQWYGAHDPAHIRDPDDGLLQRLLEGGPVSYMTVAPERPGGLALVSRLVAAGVVVAVGHCDADAATAAAAFDRGARVVTHVYNAQRRWQPRDPGVAGAGITRGDVTVTAIVDGYHLAPETVLATFAAARRRFALITDAVEAAGLADGTYRLGDRTVHVEAGAVRLADGTLAGSALTMDTAIRNLIGYGVSFVDAVDAATRVPARALGRADLGVLRPGVRADVVVLDEDLHVRRTLVTGEEHHAA